MKRSILVATAGALGLSALLGGCDGADGTVEQANSNTSWLEACTFDDDCDAVLSCLCGICTRVCGDDDCAGLDGACVHPGQPEHQLQCGGGDDLAICLARCGAGQPPCPPGQVCIGGACSARSSVDPCTAHPDALLCSSFEQEDLANEGADFASGGELGHTLEQSVYGDASLVASITGGGDRSRVRYQFEPQASGTLYLRAWMYFDVDSPEGLHVHSLTVGSVNTPDFGTNVHILDGVLGLTFAAGNDVFGSVPVPARQWFCIVTEINLDRTAGSASIWLDDELSATVTGVDTLPPDDAHDIAIGIDQTTTPECRMFVDAVVLSTVPVACLD